MERGARKRKTATPTPSPTSSEEEEEEELLSPVIRRSRKVVAKGRGITQGRLAVSPAEVELNDDFDAVHEDDVEEQLPDVGVGPSRGTRQSTRHRKQTEHFGVTGKFNDTQSQTQPDNDEDLDWSAGEEEDEEESEGSEFESAGGGGGGSTSSEGECDAAPATNKGRRGAQDKDDDSDSGGSAPPAKILKKGQSGAQVEDDESDDDSSGGGSGGDSSSFGHADPGPSRGWDWRVRLQDRSNISLVRSVKAFDEDGEELPLVFERIEPTITWPREIQTVLNNPRRATRFDHYWKKELPPPPPPPPRTSWTPPAKGNPKKIFDAIKKNLVKKGWKGRDSEMESSSQFKAMKRESQRKTKNPNNPDYFLKVNLDMKKKGEKVVKTIERQLYFSTVGSIRTDRTGSYNSIRKCNQVNCWEFILRSEYCYTHSPDHKTGLLSTSDPETQNDVLLYVPCEGGNNLKTTLLLRKAHLTQAKFLSDREIKYEDLDHVWEFTGSIEETRAVRENLKGALPFILFFYNSTEAEPISFFYQRLDVYNPATVIQILADNGITFTTTPSKSKPKTKPPFLIHKGLHCPSVYQGHSSYGYVYVGKNSDYQAPMAEEVIGMRHNHTTALQKTILVDDKKNKGLKIWQPSLKKKGKEVLRGIRVGKKLTPDQQKLWDELEVQVLHVEATFILALRLADFLGLTVDGFRLHALNIQIPTGYKMAGKEFSNFDFGEGHLELFKDYFQWLTGLKVEVTLDMKLRKTGAERKKAMKKGESATVFNFDLSALI